MYSLSNVGINSLIHNLMFFLLTNICFLKKFVSPPLLLKFIRNEMHLDSEVTSTKEFHDDVKINLQVVMDLGHILKPTYQG